MFIESDMKKGVTFPKGFKAAGVKAGIKKSGNLDVAVVYSEKDAAVAGVFTTNQVAAAPVYVSKETIANKKARVIVANAGCANACTGEEGMKNARLMAKIAATELKCDEKEVAVASTGIIGAQLPMDKMEKGIKDAVKELSVEGGINASNAIITTDTKPKTLAYELTLGGKPVRIGAMAKGSGMIQPNMATMLAFITTDANIKQELLQDALSKTAEITFNMISVDGDMSTNDMAVVLANGAADNPEITEKDEDYKTFCHALFEVCENLAKRIAADGEGATKFLTVNVTNAKNFNDAKTIAMSVAKSPLVKTAFFGEDPNWGRVICAVGYAGVDMNPDKVSIKFGDVPVYEKGQGASHDDEALKKVMAAHDIAINIDMNDGDANATVWTCDFSYEYVKINGEYHT
ncbi:MAG: bifunctional glutamate N-acetyltransferase/amino-acid acetyltransferase ArgJ [Selenomonadaceae bacterium]|nr:bifunctional glutamate N-acetyltransferase/amino-acid acetyltransferase ArgJ [Selenomonadaceae bacterium]